MVARSIGVVLLAVEFLRPAPTAAASEQNTTASVAETRRPSIVTIRTKTAITVDGRLDEEVWQRAIPATGFLQREPDEGRPSVARTEVRVVYDEHALYVGITCFSPQSYHLRARSYRRDLNPLTANDYVGFVIDPMRDGNGFGFGTNPLGAQDDWQFTGENENGNLNWNGVWDVRTSADEEGWSAEFMIPFRTLRYRAGVTASWRFNVERYVAGRAEWSFWSPIPRQFYIERVSLAGDLLDLTPSPPALNLQIKPFALAAVDRQAQAPASLDRKFGGDVKYSVTSALTLDATVHTDFSHVEVDTAQVNLTRFPLLFPEKREFFLESADLFNLVPFGYSGDVQPFFSRRIGLSPLGRPVPIVGGLRLAGKAYANGSVGLLYMRAGDLVNDPVTSETVRGADFFVARLRHHVTATSDIGGIYVGREHGDGASRLVGVDGETRLGTYGRADGYWLTSDAAGTTGQARYLEMGWTSPHVRATLSALELQDGFRADVGFVPRPAIRKYYRSLRVPVHPAWANAMGLSEIALGGFADYVTDPAAHFETAQAEESLELTRRDLTKLTVTRDDAHEMITAPFSVGRTLQVQPGNYRYGSWKAGVQTSRSRPWATTLTAQGGTFWGGTITTLIEDVTWFKAAGLSLEETYRRDHVAFGNGRETIELAGIRANFATSTRAFGDVTAQYTTLSRQIVINARLDIVHHPLSDLFVTFNEVRDTFAGIALDRTLTLKVTRLLQY